MKNRYISESLKFQQPGFSRAFNAKKLLTIKAFLLFFSAPAREFDLL